MTRLLVIAGTADAVQFVAGQPAEVEILATTFSQLGADCLAPRPGLRLHSGALDLAGFAAGRRAAGFCGGFKPPLCGGSEPQCQGGGCPAGG